MSTSSPIRSSTVSVLKEYFVSIFVLIRPSSVSVLADSVLLRSSLVSVLIESFISISFLI